MLNNYCVSFIKIEDISSSIIFQYFLTKTNTITIVHQGKVVTTMQITINCAT